MDGTETGWGRPAEPAPRWRALLDRALLGARTGEQEQVGDTGTDGTRRAEPPAAAPPPPPLPTRPVNPLDRRTRNPLDTRHPLQPQPEARPPAERPVNPLERRPERPVNPLAPRRGEYGEPRRGGAEQRPANPLERRPGRPLDGFAPRGEADDAPHSFFNPTTRSAPPPIARVTSQTGYAPARAAASVGSAAVVPPPAPEMPAVAPPVSPAVSPAATARLEWRQPRTEQETERAISVLRRQLGRPRVLAFANPKGGVHKTTATVLAAATAGSVRGRGVVAWDDNELRGTLGLRAGSARHARTIRHLVAELAEIEGLHGDELTDRLDDYLRHASDGSYDVLAGEENPRFAQRLDQSTVRRVMDLLRRTHDVICVDTGNNVESVNWQTVMRAADQLVITTVPREDAAFTADWMLDLLNDIGMEELAANAVTLLSCPSPGELPLLEDLKAHFATRTRAVAVVPYDPALEVGSSIEYSKLQQETRNAWLRAASVMLEPFAQ